MTKKSPPKQGASGALAPATAEIIELVTGKPPEAVSSGFSAAVDELLAATLSDNTKRAYASDISHFRAHGGTIPASPKQLAEYLAQFSKKHSVATLRRRVVAIAWAHREISTPTPTSDITVKAVLQGIRRTSGTKQRQVRPVVRSVLLDTLHGIDRQRVMKAARDRALLLVGFAGAFRRSELCQIDAEHVERVDGGLEITLLRSKTDQEGESRTIYIPKANGEHCPVDALAHWMSCAGIESGAIFRAVSKHGKVSTERLTPGSVARIVKVSVKRGGLDAAQFSGHSLRAGFVTEAAMQNVPNWTIKLTTGHRSDTSLTKYIRPIARRRTTSLL